MSETSVRFLITLYCEDPDARVKRAFLQADLMLPSLPTDFSLSVYQQNYEVAQTSYVAEKSRFELTLHDVRMSDWKTFLKRIDELMHVGFKVKIFPMLHKNEEQAKSAVFNCDLAGKRISAMRINGEWHTLKEDEKYWIRHNPEGIIFIPLTPEEAQEVVGSSGSKGQ